MNFLSIIFFAFIILLLIILSVIKQEKTRQNILLAASYLFYAYADYRFLFLLLAQTTIAYCSARAIDSRRQEGKNIKPILRVSLMLSIGILAVLKYANFFVEAFRSRIGGV